MEFQYLISYEKGNFFGFVMNSAGLTVFQIEDSQHMEVLIDLGIMDHIDDAEGLEVHLKNDKILEFNDIITFGGVI